MLGALCDALERAFDRARDHRKRRRDLSTLVCVGVSDGDDQCEIDLAVDYRALPAEPRSCGLGLLRFCGVGISELVVSETRKGQSRMAFTLN